MEEQKPSLLILIKEQKLLFGFLALIVIFGLYLFWHSPPTNFPEGEVVTIVPGQSLQEITLNLYNAHVIRSTFWFRTHVIMQGGEKRVIAGDYLLDKKQGPADLAYRFVNGDFHLTVFKATIPEGWNIFQISDYLNKNLINFDELTFLNLAKNKEGYLFPDTYFISPTSKPGTIISLLSKTFEEKIKTVSGVSTTTESISDVIKMASILEGEARTTENRRIISGILWRRLKIGMPLQVDSTFSYINGKNTYNLTADDLKINSPYNTYVYKGLPPTPINNPGTDAIFSALNPIKTKYLYFLTSKSGNIYYATTFEEHKRNKELYLNK
jgi:UPF0755 protein